MNINFANEIIKNLEGKGESKDYIIGFLSATLNGVRHLKDNQDILDYLARTVKQTQTQH